MHGVKTVYVAMDQEGKVLAEGSVETSRKGLQEMYLMLDPPQNAPAERTWHLPPGHLPPGRPF